MTQHNTSQFGTSVCSGTTPPMNEKINDFSPSSVSRCALEKRLSESTTDPIDIPVIIDGVRYFDGPFFYQYMPHNHTTRIAKIQCATPALIERAVQSCLKAKQQWSETRLEERQSVFARFAEYVSGPGRYDLLVETMRGQSKTCYQAEIDAACELADFLRFNNHFADTITQMQPMSTRSARNSMDYRPLEGVVLAVAPFNFTAISVNLATAPALMGNAVIWKPSEYATLSSYVAYLQLEKSGLPPGVINFVPGDGKLVCDCVLPRPDLAGLHFTGSAHVFQTLWQKIGQHISSYRNFPRIVGETGGKDFMVVHSSADEEVVLTALLRGAFEYQGQKCSALSRAYIPKAFFERIRSRLVERADTLAIGDPSTLKNFIAAVIHKKSFDRLSALFEDTSQNPNARILTSRKPDGNVGYFVPPLVVETSLSNGRLMTEEFFGPVLSIYTYEESDFEKILDMCDKTSSYGLTGAIFATALSAIRQATQKLRYAAGNFYINDKPTGAVVGQQPFGGSRTSGTNDKAGSPLNLLRWTSPRTIKETRIPPSTHDYLHMK